METEDPLHTLLAKKLAGTITSEEQKELNRLFESKQIPRAERWKQLEAKLDGDTQSFKVKPMVWIRYAAAIVIALGTIVYFYSTTDITTVTTAQGETKSTTLPDGSVVTLNGNSSIEYDAADWPEDRHIQLKGEAFFEVEKNGSGFVVESENARVAVLGTSFNVSIENETTIVACVTGKVSVDNKTDSKKIELTRGLGTTVKGETLSEAYTINTGEVMSWMNADLNFKNTDLTKVFQTLEKRYNTAIVVKKQVDSLTFTGNLASGTLNSALKTICLSARLQYSVRSDSTIVIE